MFSVTFFQTTNYNQPKKFIREQASLSCESNNSNANINFKSSNLVTKIGHLSVGENIGLKHISLDHETYFCRYLDIIEALCGCLKTKFPQGCTILNPFCSIGEESRTIASLSGDAYKIVGIDLSPDIIRNAESGIHVIKKEAHLYNYGNGSATVVNYPADRFLLLTDNLLTEKQRLFKKKLLKCFDIVSQSPNSMTIKARKETFRNLQFVQGNVLNIIETANNFALNGAKKPVGAVIAQNGFYHLLRNDKSLTKTGELILSRVNECHFEPFESAIKGIYKVLDENGIFVIGSLDRDHLNQEDLIRLSDTSFLKSLRLNGNRYCFSKTHEILARNGFQPIHWTTLSTPDKFINTNGKEEACWLSTLDIRVPSIFKKRGSQKFA